MVARKVETVDLATLSSHELLQTYSRLLTELIARGVTRSRNAPAGDVAEFIVCAAYKGQLAPKSAKSWDVAAFDGRRLQVKSRVIDANKGGTQQYSPFRSWDFDACVFVNFDSETYDVVRAFEAPADEIQRIASPTTHVGATAKRLHTRSAFEQLKGYKDVTLKLRNAMKRLD